MQLPRPTARLLSLALVVAVALLASACGGDDDSSSTDSPRSTPKPAKSASGKVLLTEAFEDPKADTWAIGKSSTIADGLLHLTALRRSVNVSGAKADIDVADVSVEADMSTDMEAGDDATYGVMCRWQFDAKGNSKNYYAFSIAPNGYASISTVTGFLWQAADAVDAVKGGTDSINRVRGDCIGDELTLYVNGIKVKTLTDDTIATGDVGVILENYSLPASNVDVDDVKVIEVS